MPWPDSGSKSRASVSGIEFNIFVYDGTGIGDFVSGNIKHSGSWEKQDTEQIMNILSKGSDGVLLDVGANLGWFSLTALHLGHKVIAFEPFISNIELLCASSTELSSAENLRLYNLGLDYRTRNCELFQKKARNIGDTHSVCDIDSRRQFLEKGYSPLGWMNTSTLDDALTDGLFEFADHIDVMKVDVEGFEHAIMDGGNQFFQSKYTPRYIYMELSSSLMGDAGGLKDRGAHRLAGVLLKLANFGYELYSRAVVSPKQVSLQTSPLEEVRRAVDGKTVLFAHSSTVNSASR